MSSVKTYSPDQYKILKQSNPSKKIAISEYNMVIEPVFKLKYLDKFIRVLKEQEIDYLIAQVDTVVESKFGERYKRAYSLFTDAGEIKHSKGYYNNNNKKGKN